MLFSAIFYHGEEDDAGNESTISTLANTDMDNST